MANDVKLAVTDEELDAWSQEFQIGEEHFRVPRLIAEVRRLRALSPSPVPAPLPGSGEAGWPPLVDLGRVLGFFASVIKSGEPWTTTCQAEYDKANRALQALYAASPTNPAESDKYPADPQAALACPDCRGTGDEGGNPSYGPCKRCGGKGKVQPGKSPSPIVDEVAELIAWLRKRGKPDSGIDYTAGGWHYDEVGPTRRQSRVVLQGVDADFIAKHFHGEGARKLADVLAASLVSPPKAGSGERVTEIIVEPFTDTVVLLLTGEGETMSAILDTSYAVELRDKLNVALANHEARGDGVRVKPLEWANDNAETPFGRYRVQRTPDGYAALFGFDDEIAHVGFNSVDNARKIAQDHCQAHFDSSIRAALEAALPPLGDGRAEIVEAWPGGNYELYEAVHNAAIAAYEEATPGGYSASALRRAVDAAIRSLSNPGGSE